jgi:hypothetical protein
MKRDLLNVIIHTILLMTIQVLRNLKEHLFISKQILIVQKIK